MSYILPEEDELIRDPDEEERRLRGLPPTYADHAASDPEQDRTSQLPTGGGAGASTGGLYADENEFGRPEQAASIEGETAKRTSRSPERDRLRAKIDEVLGQQPVRSKPKWWQSAAAIGLGGMAGYINAGRKSYIDPAQTAAAENAVTGATAYGQQREDWKRRLDAVQRQAANLDAATAADQQDQGFDTGQQVKQAQLKDYEAQAKEREATANKPTLLPGSPGTYYDPVTHQTFTPKPQAKPKPETIAPGHGIYNEETKKWEVPVPSKERDDKPTLEETATERAALADKQGLKGPARQSFILTGRLPTPPAASSVVITPQAIDQAANRYLETGEMPSFGMGKDNAVAKAKILNRAAEMNPDASIAFNKADYGASKGALNQLQKQKNQILAFENTASRNLDIALENSARTDRTGSPLINKYLLWTKGQIAGDDDTALLHNAVTTAANEYAKVISGATSGTVTDAARKEAEGMLSAALAKGTFVKVAAQMKREMGNRRSGYDQQIGDLNTALSRSAARPAGPPQQGPAPGGPAPQQNPNARQQFSESTKQYRHTLDGGRTWLPGPLPQ